MKYLCILLLLFVSAEAQVKKPVKTPAKAPAETQVKDEWIRLPSDYDDLTDYERSFLNITTDYYNRAKVIRDKNLISFWIKTVPGNKSSAYKHYFSRFGNVDPDKMFPYAKYIDFSKFQFTLTLYQGDCKKMLIGTKQMVDRWDLPDVTTKVTIKHDGVRYSFPAIVDLNEPLEPAIPGSHGESWLLKACAVKK